MARWVFLAILLPSMLALGLAESRRQFAHLEGRASDGSAVQLRAAPESQRVADGLRVVVADADRRIELLLPSDANAADHVVASLSLVDASGVHAGRATLDVEEAGSYLAGRLRGSAGDLVLTGGLRFRRP